MKQKVLHELGEFFRVFLYLAPWFCAFSTYRMLILSRFTDVSFDYGTALLNALVLSKVILVGEFFHLGKRHEDRPLIYSTIYKSFLFALLAAAFRIVELMIRARSTASVWSRPWPLSRARRATNSLAAR